MVERNGDGVATNLSWGKLGQNAGFDNFSWGRIVTPKAPMRVGCGQGCPLTAGGVV